MKRLAILASGSGSNAEQIIQQVRDDQSMEVACVISNRPEAGVLERARKHGIPIQVFRKNVWSDSEEILNFFDKNHIDFIVLAGYLQKIPDYLIQAYPDRIVNIHPALLPAYGGKGMYGMHVHRAVHKAREKFSGITIHLVNEYYDEGEIILQAKCPIRPEDTPEDIQQRVLELEHQYYPLVVRYLASF